MKAKAMRLTPILSLAARGSAIAALILVSLGISPAWAGAPVRISGQLVGLVTNIAGNPQPGAMVVLLNQQDRPLGRSTTDSLGSFAFADLVPDLYSIQVSSYSFVPAVKQRIQVKAGMRSLLSVNLSHVFSSVQLVSTTAVPAGLMNDNWKWTLRTDNQLRPILRILPVGQSGSSANGSFDPDKAESFFTDSRGILKISAGDGEPVDGDTQADLGTEFAFVTSLYGANRLQVAGDFGYGANAGAPSGAFRTTFSRELPDGATPDISVTMRQFYVPMRLGQSFYGGPASDGSSLPVLRTAAVSFGDKAQLSDALRMDYGFELDEVTLLNHLHYFSPYTKFTYALPHGDVDFTWTSGNGRPELGMSAADPNADLQRDLASLSTIPGVTLANGQSRVQRGDDYELGISQRFGSREFRVSAYQENVSNTALTIASPSTGLFAGDLLPNLFANSASFDMGRFDNFGYTAAVTQDLGENYKVTLMYGSVAVIAPMSAAIPGDTSDDLRRILDAGHRPALTVQVSGTVKRTGTRFVAGYQWTDYQSATPGPMFSTESTRPEPGLNVMVRQPVPALPRMPWRIEATAELRNLLAQGYLPLTTASGDQVLLVNNPRSIRGALAFLF